MLRFTTAGESHGPALTVVVDGLPAGVPVDRAAIDDDLRRRQGGYGRGGRMKIETDTVEITAGVRHGLTIGSPVSLLVRNRDHENWRDVMSPDPQPDAARERRRLRFPRPGHADLAGALKYGTRDLRNVLERASARETTMRVAAGGLARGLLRAAGVEIRSHVVRIGRAALPAGAAVAWAALDRVEESPVRCVDPAAGERMIAEIDRAKKDGDTVGGVAEVIARGLPPGLGSLRPVGPEARRPHRPGADVDPRRQGGGPRRGLRGRQTRGARPSTTRSCGARREASSGPPTAPAGSRAA